MKLYLLTNPEPQDYDQFLAVVVCAKSPKDAREIHPCEFTTTEDWEENENSWDNDWPKYKNRHKIKVEYIGTPKAGQKKGVILSSFNAG